jgi:hypothetical protein
MSLTDTYGVALALYPASTAFGLELRRAPDSAGAPDLGNVETLALVEGTRAIFLDLLPNDGLTRWYSVRHVRAGWTDSPWTDWFDAVPARLHDRYERGAFGAPFVLVDKVDGPNGNTTTQITLTAVAPGRAVTLLYAMGTAALAAAPSNPYTVTIDRDTNVVSDRILRAQARGEDGSESVVLFIVVDWDKVPEISMLTTPAPWYDSVSKTQKGWTVDGVVDDDTRGLFVVPNGLGAFTSIPAATAVTIGSPGYWLDLSSSNTFQLQALEDPGAFGNLAVTPYELSASGAPGLAGEVVNVPLVRAPVTVASTREDTANIRVVTLTATPSTATIRYRLNGGTWLEATGTVELRLDVSSAAVTLEFNAVVNDLVEPARTMTFDANPDPAILEGSGPREEPANQITMTVNTDDDVIRVGIWAIRVDAGDPELWPVVVGTNDPDGNYAKGLRWYASDGDWYIILRAYGNRSQWVEERYTITVTGAAATPGALEDPITATQVLVIGSPYHQLDWAYDSVVDASGLNDYAVTVREDGVEILSLADARDPRYPSDTPVGSTGLVTGTGGVRFARPWVSSGDPGAEAKTWAYEIRLYDGPALVATYYRSISGYVVPGTEGTAPTEAPSRPFLDYLGSDLWQSNWFNTRSDLDLEVEWTVTSGTFEILSDNTTVFTNLVVAGSTSDTGGGDSSSTQARARARYMVGELRGPWSSYSSWRNKVP